MADVKCFKCGCSLPNQGKKSLEREAEDLLLAIYVNEPRMNPERITDEKIAFYAEMRADRETPEGYTAKLAKEAIRLNRQARVGGKSLR